jgi:hypothetical protein
MSYFAPMYNELKNVYNLQLVKNSPKATIFNFKVCSLGDVNELLDSFINFVTHVSS